MITMKFEKKSTLGAAQDEKGITIKVCSDYKKRSFSKRCRFEKKCKNAKRIRRTLINQWSGEVSFSFYQIRCDGRLFICNICEKEFIVQAEAITCSANHEAKK